MNTDLENGNVVYVVDDDRSVRASLADLFSSVGLDALTFESVKEFVDHSLETRPACLVLDVRMPGQSGIDFQQRMAGLGLRMPVIFITGHGDIAMGVKAIKDGAFEFLSKPFRDQELLDAVHQALERDQHRLQHDAEVEELRSRMLSLSSGERDVFELVVQGQLNKQIAAKLDVKEVTVKVRRAHVMQKMQARSLADLVRMFDRLAHEPAV
ncbi:response regulator transcription factor [Ensifer sp. ENS06]|uniref:response regulator transcription factor n=1 Tax=Ensifer sp. ENS06 TaxID=2769276 RepID=UPI00178749FC|nr:response regulator transcription factor [Ensifer sp. ENS06]MBD9627033.1 response regulator transcription factor [Ensifer sp. ENS06]